MFILVLALSIQSWHCIQHPVFLAENDGNTKGKGLYFPETSIFPFVWKNKVLSLHFTSVFGWENGILDAVRPHLELELL